ncbi:MAG: DUF3617 domain-containing protein [Acidobacteriota bacterium]|nr:DUF3617 domain-containing protein [Acidobacteriota bacterium]
MRKYVTYVLAGLTVMAAVVPASAATSPQKPGKWQIKMQMDMPGMPFKMPPVTTEVCLTEEDLNNPEKAVPSDPKAKCTISDYKVDGNKVTWSMDCPKQDTKGTGEITYDGDSYDGSMKMTVGEQVMTTKYSGKWLGACKK